MRYSDLGVPVLAALLDQPDEARVAELRAVLPYLDLVHDLLAASDSAAEHIAARHGLAPRDPA